MDVDMHALASVSATLALAPARPRPSSPPAARGESDEGDEGGAPRCDGGASGLAAALAGACFRVRVRVGVRVRVRVRVTVRVRVSALEDVACWKEAA